MYVIMLMQVPCPSSLQRIWDSVTPLFMHSKDAQLAELQLKHDEVEALKAEVAALKGHHAEDRMRLQEAAHSGTSRAERAESVRR